MLAAVLAPLLVAAMVGQAHVPLSIVVRQEVEPNRWDLQVINTGDTPVVAWSFEVVDADGQQYGWTRDVYVQLLGDRPNDGILHPGAPTIVDYHTGARLDGATITPRAVVYADATAVGDARTIQSIFDARRAQADALADLIPKLETLAQAGLTVDALKAASVAVDDPTRNRRGSGAYQGAAQNLRLFATSPTPEVAFHSWLERLRREADLAREHSFRRP